MKKVLTFGVVPVLMLVLLTGCSTRLANEQKAEMPDTTSVAEQNVASEDTAANLQDPALTTDVKPLDQYASPDDALADIDKAASGDEQF